jgi:hypothetical protein
MPEISDGKIQLHPRGTQRYPQPLPTILLATEWLELIGLLPDWGAALVKLLRWVSKQ